MRFFGILALCIFVALPAGAKEALTADAILKKMDQNLVSDKRTATIEMTVVNRGRTRTFVMESFSRGETEHPPLRSRLHRSNGTEATSALIFDQSRLEKHYPPTFGLH